MCSTIASSSSGTPSPVFAEMRSIVARRDAEHALDLPRDPVGVGRGEVDLVHRGDDREVVLEREVAVGEGLRLDPLRRVDEEEHAFARGEAARDLVAEVDVARACR